jgi:hypothetical protein
MQEQTTAAILLRARQQMIELEEADDDDDSLLGMFKRAAINAIDSHTRLISGFNSLVIKTDEQNDEEQDLREFFLDFK